MSKAFQSISKHIEEEIDLFALNIEFKPEVAFYQIEKAYKQSVGVYTLQLIGSDTACA